jgi:hypothetical protein
MNALMCIYNVVHIVAVFAINRNWLYVLSIEIQQNKHYMS